MGLIPESMGKANMYGVELDPVSGRIAKQLYQKNKIAVQGFEETSYPDSFFDCVIGNVPFGAYQVSDRRYDRHHFMIHDYFIAKSLDLVRPGGPVKSSGYSHGRLPVGNSRNYEGMRRSHRLRCLVSPGVTDLPTGA